MSLRQSIREAVEAGRLGELEALLRTEPRAVRYLVALTYQPESATRAVACRGVALAARHHPRLVARVVRRLVWAMNDESGTHAVTAPEVLRAIAEEEPELLLPMVPDITRLAADDGLREGLVEVLRTVAEGCPGEVGHSIGESLRRQYRRKKKRKRDIDDARDFLG